MRPRRSQIKIDQGRSLSICVHHEDVLRRLVTMMVKVIATGISTRPFQYTETPDHTSSRPSDYSLVKEQFFSSRLSSLTCYAAESYGFVVVTFFQCLSAPGRRIIASPPTLSIGCREKFFSRRPTDFSAVSDRPLRDVLYRHKPVQNWTKETFGHGVFGCSLSARATRSRAPSSTPQFKHHGKGVQPFGR